MTKMRMSKVTVGDTLVNEGMTSRISSLPTGARATVARIEKRFGALFFYDSADELAFFGSPQTCVNVES